MIMDKTLQQQQNDSNTPTAVTNNERETLINNLVARLPFENSKRLDIARRVENQVFQKSNGMKPNYFTIAHNSLQDLQKAIIARTNQQRQAQLAATANNNGPFPNSTGLSSQSLSMPQTNSLQHSLNPLNNQLNRFPVQNQQVSPRLSNSQQNVLQQMTRPTEASKFNTLSFSASLSPSTSNISSMSSLSPVNTNSTSISNIDLTQNYSQLQPRYPNATATNPIRARPTLPSSTNYSPLVNNNESLHQLIVGPLPSTNLHLNNNQSNDLLLHRMLLPNNDGPATRLTASALTRPVTSTMMNQPIRSQNPPATTTIINTNNNSTTQRTPLTSSQLAGSPSLLVLPPSSQTSTVQIQPSNNLTIQQSPLNANNVSFSANAQPTVSITTTPTMNTNPSTINRPVPTTATGTITNLDEETSNLIKFLRDNVGILQIYSQRFSNDNQADRVRQIQVIQQQIHGFIANPTYERIQQAKTFRDTLEKLISRMPTSNASAATTTTASASAAPPPPPPVVPAATPVAPLPAAPVSVPSVSSSVSSATPPTIINPATVPATTNAPISSTSTTATTTTITTTTIQPKGTVFSQCSKAINEFLLRDPKERRPVTKRCLEPLSDVINGVPHKIIRLDADRYSKVRVRSSNSSSRSFLSIVNDEINHLPLDVYSIERTALSRTMKNKDEEHFSRTGISLRCKLLSRTGPAVPPLRLYISSRYPQQSPEILSLTKTTPPQLDFAEGHLFLEKISSIFLAHVFQLPSQHSITDILHLWCQSVQTAL